MSKIVAKNEELVKFFQIFERFTNLSSTGVNNESQVQRTAIEAIRFILRMDPERETSSRRDKESAEKVKAFQPSDHAQRTNSHWINKKVHEV
jgi:hypothetical protein